MIQKLLMIRLWKTFEVNKDYIEFEERLNFQIDKDKVSSLRITINNRSIPYSILPAEFLINQNQNTLAIMCLKKYWNEIKNTLKNITRESEISSQLEASIQPYIDNTEKLPGKDYFYHFLKTKDYYFGPTYTLEGSLSIKDNCIWMKAPSYISDELQKDLNQYSSSLS